MARRRGAREIAHGIMKVEEEGVRQLADIVERLPIVAAVARAPVPGGVDALPPFAARAFSRSTICTYGREPRKCTGRRWFRHAGAEEIRGSRTGHSRVSRRK
jgi:hypothetical protein